MKRIIFLVLAAVPFFVIGCASNPPSVTIVKKETPAPVAETKKEIIFPSDEPFSVTVKNGDMKAAKVAVAAKLVSAMKKECQWKQPLEYYGDKVTVEAMVTKDMVMHARARMDSSLCPEKH